MSASSGGRVRDPQAEPRDLAGAVRASGSVPFQPPLPPADGNPIRLTVSFALETKCTNILNGNLCTMQRNHFLDIITDTFFSPIKLISLILKESAWR